MITTGWQLALKLFLPSWNFFNDFSVVPHLEVLCSCTASDAGKWQPAYPGCSTRSLARVFWNPWGNRELLEKSLIARVATGLADGSLQTEDFSSTEEFKMLLRVAREKFPVGLQRVRLVLRAPELIPEVLFESPDLASIA